MYRSNGISICDEARDLLPAYCMGALDTDEMQLVKRGLEECPALQAELQAYLAVSQHLLVTTPLKKPSPTLKASLMQKIANDKPLTPSPDLHMVKPKTVEMPIPSTAKRRTSEVPVAHIVQPMVEKIRAMPDESLQTPSRPRQPFKALRWVTTAAAILTLVLFSVNLYWTVSLYNQQRSLALSPTAMPAPIMSELPQVTEQESVSHVDLMVHDNSIPASGALSWVAVEDQDQDGWVAWFVGENLTPPPEGLVYHLMVRHEGQPPISIGQFTVDERGKAVYVFHVHESFRVYDRVEVTLGTEEGELSVPDSPVLEAEL